MNRQQDLNRTVKVSLGQRGGQTFNLVPSTEYNDLVVLQEGCQGCDLDEQEYYSPAE